MIYVDCDDTLVLYRIGDGSSPDDSDINPNYALIQALSDVPGDGLWIWSAAGAEYAESWRQELLPRARFSSAKDVQLPKPEDTCIDDESLSVVAECVTWEKYIERRV